MILSEVGKLSAADFAPFRREIGSPRENGEAAGD
jgi:hypothetical protein